MNRWQVSTGITLLARLALGVSIHQSSPSAITGHGRSFELNLIPVRSLPFYASSVINVSIVECTVSSSCHLASSRSSINCPTHIKPLERLCTSLEQLVMEVFVCIRLSHRYTLIYLSYASLVCLSNLSSRSSSSINAGSWDLLNILSSMSRKSHIVSRPELLGDATYKLKRFNVPVGGGAMSTMT